MKKIVIRFFFLILFFIIEIKRQFGLQIKKLIKINFPNYLIHGTDKSILFVCFIYSENNYIKVIISKI